MRRRCGRIVSSEIQLSRAQEWRMLLPGEGETLPSPELRISAPMEGVVRQGAAATGFIASCTLELILRDSKSCWAV